MPVQTPKTLWNFIKMGVVTSALLHVYYVAHIFKTTCFQLVSNHDWQNGK